MSSCRTDGRVLRGGTHRIVLTARGTGLSSTLEATRELALTRWSRDPVEDCDGFFVYLRDLEDERFWSVGAQPVVPTLAAAYGMRSRQGAVRIARREHGIESVLETCIDPETSAELRSLTVRNRSRRVRRIEITTYVEIVLNEWASDAGHPAFSKLFIETARVGHEGILLARRRPRSRDESFPWLAHALHGPGPSEIETDRARFLGRGRSVRAPLALVTSAPLSGTVGSVLDPVLAVRRIVEIAPGTSVVLAGVLVTASTRTTAVDTCRRFEAPSRVAAAFKSAAFEERARARRHGLRRTEADHLQALAVGMLHGDPGLRSADVKAPSDRPDPAEAVADASALPAGRFLLLVEADHAEIDEAYAASWVRATRYWRELGLDAAWVLVCTRCAADAEPCGLCTTADGLRRDGLAAVALTRGSNAGTLASARCRADVVFDGNLANACRDFARVSDATSREPLRVHARMPDDEVVRAAKLPPNAPHLREDQERAERSFATGLRRYNGYGGFAADGSEYRILVDPRRESARPPMPWINVIANPSFGFLVSEGGAGYTWSRNSRIRRLSHWSNDPVTDPHSEALWIVDEDRRLFWSPLPGPTPAAAPYEVAHGFGYSAWNHTSHGLEQHVSMFVPPDAALKIVRVRVRNTSDEARTLALVFYARLVLGDLPDHPSRVVGTEIDARAQVLFARSSRGDGFDDTVVFAAAITAPGADVSMSADRLAFLGAASDPGAPAALLRGGALDGRAGLGLDPCTALRVELSAGVGETVECSFVLGEASTEDAARAVLEAYRARSAVEATFLATRAHWSELLGATRIETPSEAIDLVANGWLLYQATSCRLWGRSAFYQSGGAFGFRDQLQDATALVYARPELVREQILLHARHQFVEGDVLHWWHPPVERGTRTRFSDDLLWLPYVTAFYIETTGDTSVLDELAGFVRGPLLAPGQDEDYIAVEPAGALATVWEHCALAIDRSLTRGAHGLPLMGTGDWNDGMNRVGREGKGESVWLGFFLYDVLRSFVPLSAARGDHERAQRYSAYREALHRALETAGWDGAWYRRAYYDDGRVLGSATNQECRIDAVAQAWAVLSGGAAQERGMQALDELERQLLVEEAGLIRLLTPPFDRTAEDPGYIKGYVPGIRENGGQYTHAALWAVRAAARLGRRDRVARWLEMLSPVTHAATRSAADVYKVEPYVVVADIYGVPPHLGRGGWTWYTGSAAWMYRTIVESLLGITFDCGDVLVVSPCIPDDWAGFSAKHGFEDGTTYDIVVENPQRRAARVLSASADGAAVTVRDGAARIPLERDGRMHRVTVTLG